MSLEDSNGSRGDILFMMNIWTTIYKYSAVVGLAGSSQHYEVPRARRLGALGEAQAFSTAVTCHKVRTRQLCPDMGYTHMFQMYINTCGHI